MPMMSSSSSKYRLLAPWNACLSPIRTCIAKCSLSLVKAHFGSSSYLPCAHYREKVLKSVVGVRHWMNTYRCRETQNLQVIQRVDEQRTLPLKYHKLVWEPPQRRVHIFKNERKPAPRALFCEEENRYDDRSCTEVASTQLLASCERKKGVCSRKKQPLFRTSSVGALGGDCHFDC